MPIPSQIPKVEVTRLLDFLNVESEDELKLIVGWLIAAFQQPGPFPVLVLHGEQGSAKSTTVKVIRDLLDPNTASLRKEPKNSDDLLVSANSNWIVAVDNVSYLPDWLSDDFCRLATGGGLAKRQLYSDDDEFVLNVKRPIILNGIDEFVARGDLADRAILINLPSISKAGRKREETSWTEFNIVRPALFSLLLDAISHALANKNSFELDEKPRMADAWHWVSAAEPAFGWQRGSSLNALRENQFKVNEIILSSSPLYPFIRQLADEMWAGNAELLLTRFNNMQGTSHAMTSKNLPNNPRALGDKIRRLAPALRVAGIDVKMEKTSGSNSVRMIYFRKLPNSCDASDASTPNHSDGDGRDDCVDINTKISAGEVDPITS